jgi:hypothetical protein
VTDAAGAIAATPGLRQVPAYTVDEFAPRRARHCVAISVINEDGRLLAQLDRMKPLAGQVDVLLADGGSTDGSTERARLAEKGVRVLLTKMAGPAERADAHGVRLRARRRIRGSSRWTGTTRTIPPRSRVS